MKTNRGRSTALLLFLTTGCWDGWKEIFDPTPSREHRVEDLRVLAVLSEPASLAVPPQFFFDEANATPIQMEVRPQIFDPRGGEIDMRISICSTADAFIPCQGVGIALVQQTIRADQSDVLGLVDDLAFTISLGPDDVRALYADIGITEPVLFGIVVEVVVEVSRKVGQIVERERAVLPFEMRLDVFDPAMPADALDALLTTSAAALCSPDNPSCFSEEPSEPECGNGVVEPGESCDPPGEDGCDEFCFSENDFCGFVEQPACVPPVIENERPLLLGVSVVTDPFRVPESADIEPGGEIEVPVGSSILVMPVVDRTANIESPQLLRGFVDPSCPPDTPGGSAKLSCGNTDLPTYRFYVADGRAELTSPNDGQGNYIGNQGFFGEAVGVAFTAGTARGTREPLVVVLSDGRGGMDLATFTIVAE